MQLLFASFVGMIAAKLVSASCNHGGGFGPDGSQLVSTAMLCPYPNDYDAPNSPWYNDNKAGECRLF